MSIQFLLWRKDAFFLEQGFRLFFASTARVAPLVLSAALSLFAGTCGHADTPTDHEKRERELRSQQEQTPEISLPHAEVPLASQRYSEIESPCFPISHIRLVGDDAWRFTFALTVVTEGSNPDHIATGRCLGVQGINLALTHIQNAIVVRGYITTRVLAKPQDLKSGELVFTVVPGRIHSVRLSPDSSSRGSLWNAFPISSGDILNLRDIEQGLENLKRIPTAEADIQIEPAKTIPGVELQSGESDLIVRYQQTFPFRLSLTADDGGAKQTGKYQSGITLSCDNCTTQNDLFYASFNHNLGGDKKHGAKWYTAYYSIPYGYGLASASTNTYHYHQTVGGAFQSYLYSGKSTLTDLKFSYGVYRDAVRKFGVSLRGFVRKSENFINDTEVESQGLDARGLDFELHHREHLWASTLEGTLTYRRGRGTGVFTEREPSPEALGQRTKKFQLILADINLNVPFTVNTLWGKQKMSYQTSWRAEWDLTPLMFQDRFSIGGRYTVRGFDGERSLSAGRGWLTRNDLSFALGHSEQEFYVGADYGQARGSGSFRKSPFSGELAGAAFGLRGRVFKHLQYDLFLGWPIKKPKRFKTADTTGGFSVSTSF